MPGNNGGRHTKWTEDLIMRTLAQDYLTQKKKGKKKRIPLAGNGSIYANLSRRVKKGEFGSVKGAIEQLWFRGLVILDIDRAAEWIVDTAIERNSGSIKRLNRLIKLEGEAVRQVLKEICRPCYPAAQAKVKEFADTRPGKQLRKLLSAKAPA